MLNGQQKPNKSNVIDPAYTVNVFLTNKSQYKLEIGD